MKRLGRALGRVATAAWVELQQALAIVAWTCWGALFLGGVACAVDHRPYAWAACWSLGYGIAEYGRRARGVPQPEILAAVGQLLAQVTAKVRGGE